MYFFWGYDRSILLEGFSFSPQSLHPWQPKSSLQVVNLEAANENGMLKEAFVVFFHGDSSQKFCGVKLSNLACHFYTSVQKFSKHCYLPFLFLLKRSGQLGPNSSASVETMRQSTGCMWMKADTELNAGGKGNVMWTVIFSCSLLLTWLRKLLLRFYYHVKILF